jgi:hypothetical protein
MGLRGSQWVFFCTPRSRGQERRHDCTFQGVLITLAVGPPLEDADLVVKPLHEAEADLVLRVAG